MISQIFGCGFGPTKTNPTVGIKVRLERIKKPANCAKLNLLGQYEEALKSIINLGKTEPKLARQVARFLMGKDSIKSLKDYLTKENKSDEWNQICKLIETDRFTSYKDSWFCNCSQEKYINSEISKIITKDILKTEEYGIFSESNEKTKSKLEHFLTLFPNSNPAIPSVPAIPETSCSIPEYKKGLLAISENVIRVVNLFDKLHDTLQMLNTSGYRIEIIPDNSMPVRKDFEQADCGISDGTLYRCNQNQIEIVDISDNQELQTQIEDICNATSEANVKKQQLKILLDKNENYLKSKGLNPSPHGESEALQQIVNLIKKTKNEINELIIGTSKKSTFKTENQSINSEVKSELTEQLRNAYKAIKNETEKGEREEIKERESKNNKEKESKNKQLKNLNDKCKNIIQIIRKQEKIQKQTIIKSSKESELSIVVHTQSLRNAQQSNDLKVVKELHDVLEVEKSKLSNLCECGYYKSNLEDELNRLNNQSDKKLSMNNLIEEIDEGIKHLETTIGEINNSVIVLLEKCKKECDNFDINLDNLEAEKLEIERKICNYNKEIYELNNLIIGNNINFWNEVTKGMVEIKKIIEDLDSNSGQSDVEDSESDSSPRPDKKSLTFKKGLEINVTKIMTDFREQLEGLLKQNKQKNNNDFLIQIEDFHKTINKLIPKRIFGLPEQNLDAVKAAINAAINDFESKIRQLQLEQLAEALRPSMKLQETKLLEIGNSLKILRDNQNVLLEKCGLSYDSNLNIDIGNEISKLRVPKEDLENKVKDLEIRRKELDVELNNKQELYSVIKTKQETLESEIAVLQKNIDAYHWFQTNNSNSGFNNGGRTLEKEAYEQIQKIKNEYNKAIKQLEGRETLLEGLKASESQVNNEKDDLQNNISTTQKLNEELNALTERYKRLEELQSNQSEIKDFLEKKAVTENEYFVIKSFINKLLLLRSKLIIEGEIKKLQENNNITIDKGNHNTPTVQNLIRNLDDLNEQIQKIDQNVVGVMQKPNILNLERQVLQLQKKELLALKDNNLNNNIKKDNLQAINYKLNILEEEISCLNENNTISNNFHKNLHKIFCNSNIECLEKINSLILNLMIKI